MPLKAVKKLLRYYSTVLLIFAVMVTRDCCINVKLLTENPAASLAFLHKLAKQNHHKHLCQEGCQQSILCGPVRSKNQ